MTPDRGHRRRPRLAALVAAVVLGGATVAPASTAAAASADTSALAAAPRSAAVPVVGTAGYPEQTLRARLTSRSGTLVPTLVGRVTDPTTDRVIWRRGGATPVVPASTAKVTTGLTALSTFGAGHRYRTTVFRGQAAPRTLYLYGSGDPTLSSARLRSLAVAVAKESKARGIRRVDVRYDDYLFPAPTNASGWLREDVPRWVAPVRALVRDQRNLANTSLDAATYFSKQLAANGVSVASTRRGRTPAARVRVAHTSSPTMSTIVGDMLRLSQNDYAEALLWTSGIKAGAPRTWAGVTGYSRQTLARHGVPVTSVVIRDGSGISRSNRTTAETLSVLASAIYRDPALHSVFFAPNALPVAGRTGTLETRFATAPSSCAKGLVVAKTGSLKDVSALMGIAKGVDGKPRAFAFVSNKRKNTSAVRTRIDVLAATATMCM